MRCEGEEEPKTPVTFISRRYKDCPDCARGACPNLNLATAMEPLFPYQKPPVSAVG